MTNACIAYENISDGATITASSSQLQMPAIMVQNEHILRKWRGASGGNDFILASYSSNVLINTIAVMGVEADTIRVRVSSVDTSGTAGDLYDSGIVPVDNSYKSSIHLMPEHVLASFVRIDLSTSGSFVEIGRLFSGLRHTFSFNFSKGWSRKWTDRSLKTKTRGGQTNISPDISYRTIDVSFDFLTEDDRNGFVETIDRVNSQKTDVLFVTNPASANLSRDSVWGLMTDISAVVQPYANSFSKPYSIEERL